MYCPGRVCWPESPPPQSAPSSSYEPVGRIWVNLGPGPDIQISVHVSFLKVCCYLVTMNIDLVLQVTKLYKYVSLRSTF